MSDVIPTRHRRQACFSRRTFLQTAAHATAGVVTLGASAVQVALPPSSAAAQPDMKQAEKATAMEPTPACNTHQATRSQTAGPFYTPDTPARTNLLEPGITGTILVVTGRVFTTDCQPIAGALLDFWQADAAGVYDNAGYRLRGHQVTDENGTYRLRTVVPGVYPGRTRHIHVRVQGPATRRLTTQLYFPSERLNKRDGLFHPALVMDVEDTSEGDNAATFDFILVTS